MPWLLLKCTLNRVETLCVIFYWFSLRCNMGNYLIREPVRYDSHSRSRESDRTDPLTKWPRLSRRPEMVVQRRYTENKSIEMHILIFRCDVLRINIFFLIIADEDDNVYTLILYSNSLFFCKEEGIAMHQ